MSCERYQEALSDHAAGAPARPELERHLDACAECRSELLALREALASADASLAELASAEPSPAFRARLRLHVEAASEPRPRFFFASRLASWLAAAAAVVVAALLMGRGANRPVAPAVATAPAPALSPPLPSTVSGVSPSAPSPPAPAARAVVGPVLVRRAPAQRPPDVIVSSDQQRALVDYVALVASQRASPAALLSAGEPSADLSQPRMQIEPLEIAPLDPAEVQGR